MQGFLWLNEPRFLSFLLIVCLTGLFFLTYTLSAFQKKLKKIVQFSLKISEGGKPDTTTQWKGSFGELISNISAISAKLREEAESAKNDKGQIVAILESMAEAVIVVDANGCVLLVNSALRRFFDLKVDTLLDRYYWEIFRDSDLNEMIRHSLEEKTTLSNEHTVSLANVTFQIQISPVFSEGEFLGVAAVFHDVTKIKELERIRYEFVANVSHELKTPLTSIIGFVETLKEGAIEDTKNRGRFLDIVDEHAQKLRCLIEDLLLLSRVESGKEELKKEPVALETILKSLEVIFKSQIKEKRITVEYDLVPQPFFIVVESKIFERALSNLIDNALKYNIEDGKIVIRAFYNQDTAVIEISDSGMGIPDQDIERIFERFYRVDKSRSRESGGSGLGLSIVKHIVEKHSGRVEAKSHNEKGATFVIRLPRF